MKEAIIQYNEDPNNDINLMVISWKPIVRCKDCEYGVKSPTFQHYPEITWCNKHSTSHNDDWFCADGERKKSNA